MYVMMSPAPRTSDKTKVDPVIMRLQSQLSNLIYRYLANKNSEYEDKSSYHSSCMMENNDHSRIINQNSDHLSVTMDKDSGCSFDMITKNSPGITQNSDNSSSMMTKNSHNS